MVTPCRCDRRSGIRDEGAARDGARVGEPFVLDVSDSASSSFTSRTDVTAGASLSVEDIVFRNQQAEAQAQAFATVIASLRTKLHFRASPTQVFDVITDNRYFSSRDSIEWEELSFSVNGTRWGPDHRGCHCCSPRKC